MVGRRRRQVGDLHEDMKWSAGAGLRIMLGSGIIRIDFAVDVSGSRFQGSADWRYTGGLVFFKLNFGGQ